jgi:hypothetical protein
MLYLLSYFIKHIQNKTIFRTEATNFSEIHIFQHTVRIFVTITTTDKPEKIWFGPRMIWTCICPQLPVLHSESHYMENTFQKIRKYKN